MALIYTLSVDNQNETKIHFSFIKSISHYQCIVLNEDNIRKNILLRTLEGSELSVSLYKYSRYIKYGNFQFLSKYNITFKLDKNELILNDQIIIISIIINLILDNIATNYLVSFNSEVLILYKEESCPITLNLRSRFWNDKLIKLFDHIKYDTIDEEREIDYYPLKQ